MEKKSLEKILSPVRLGWHGVLVGLAGAVGIYFSEHPMIDAFSGTTMAMGAIFYLDALGSFLRTRKHIKKHKDLDKRFVKSNISAYCNRQGARTAAANYGLAEKFDETVKEYKHDATLKFIPHI